MLPATSVSKIVLEKEIHFFSKYIADMHNVFVYIAPLQLGAKYVSTFPAVCLSVKIRLRVYSQTVRHSSVLI